MKKSVHVFVSRHVGFWFGLWQWIILHYIPENYPSLSLPELCWLLLLPVLRIHPCCFVNCKFVCSKYQSSFPIRSFYLNRVCLALVSFSAVSKGCLLIVIKHAGGVTKDSLKKNSLLKFWTVRVECQVKKPLFAYLVFSEEYDFFQDDW